MFILQWQTILIAILMQSLSMYQFQQITELQIVQVLRIINYN